MRSGAATVEDYLAELPADRREALAQVRRLVLASLPAGYLEAMNWGMIAYEVPLAVSGRTYNGKPLMIAAIASQKRHMALYLCGVSCLPDNGAALARDFAASGRRLDMGRACLRFRRVEDLDLDAVAAVLAAVAPDELVAASLAAHARRRA